MKLNPANIIKLLLVIVIIGIYAINVNSAEAQYCVPAGSNAALPQDCCSGIGERVCYSDGYTTWCYYVCQNPPPTPPPNVPPSMTNVTINSGIVTANGSSQYAIQITSLDRNGGTDIANQYVQVGGGAGGLLGWSTNSFPWWGGNYKPGSMVACGGYGGYGVIYGGAEWNPQNVNLISCSSQVSGEYMATTFVVSFNPSYVNPMDNLLYGFTGDSLNQPDGYYAYPGFSLNKPPVSTNAYLRAIPDTGVTPLVVADGTTRYNITVTADDPNGGSDVDAVYSLINLQGTNGGLYRGWVAWLGLNWWPGNSPINCSSGGGYGAEYLDPAYGEAYINLYDCTTSLSGNTRITTFTVSFNPNFTTPVDNTISAIVYDWGGNQDPAGWRAFGTFQLSKPPTTTNAYIRAIPDTGTTPLVVPNGSIRYDLVTTADDPNGGNDIAQLYNLRNYIGTGAPLYRGYLSWFPAAWWPAGWSQIGCNPGGGYGYSVTGQGWGEQHINLHACATYVSNNTRTTIQQVSFNPSYTDPLDNTIDGYSVDSSGQGDPGGWKAFGTYKINQKPTLGTATISPKPVIADGVNQYTITISASDTNGVSDIGDMLTNIDWFARGVIGWSKTSFGWWGGNLKAGSLKTCTNTGTGAADGSIGIYGGGQGMEYVNTVSCTTSTSGNTRTVSMIVTFTTLFTSPASNDLYGFVSDFSWFFNDWTLKDNFNLATNLTGRITTPTGTGIDGVVINPTGGPCNTPQAITSGGGYFTIPNITVGTVFCIRPTTPNGYTTPVATNSVNPGNYTSYDCQVAGVSQSPDGCGTAPSKDLSVDNAYNFNFTAIPSFTLSGSVKFDVNNDSCATGTNYTGALVKLYNSSNTQMGSGSSSGAGATNYSFSALLGNPYYSVISGLPANYTVKSATLVGGGGSLSGFTYSGINFNQDKTLNWCVSNLGAWFQTGDGDVRFSDFVDSLPSGKIISTIPTSAFFSSNSDVNFGAGNNPPGYVINSEYGYNDDPKSKNGLFSYTFFMNRAKVKQQSTPLMSGCPASGTCTMTPAALTTLFSTISGPGAIYWVNGDLNITGAGTYTHPAGKHVLILINGALTIDIPQNTAIRVPAGAGNLLVMAAKDDINISPNVGLSSPNPTQCIDSSCTSLEGIYTSEKSITLQPKTGSCFSGGNTSDNQFNFAGNFVTNALKPFKVGGPGKFQIKRSLCANDANYPAMTIQGRYDFIPQLTDFYKTPSIRWKELNP